MKSRPYFEGWYFKHQVNNETISIIPGINIDRQQNPHIFIQIITSNTSHFVVYPISEFKLCRVPLKIQIGNNYFSEKGIKLDIDFPGIRLKGQIKYQNLIPLKYHIMGPLIYIPFLECFHGILSLHHQLTGKLTMNENIINFNNGLGYMEKDWGHSFPKKYLWTQCNNFGEGIKEYPQSSVCGIMAALAQIPIGCFRFWGCTGVVYYQGRQYRFATYLGARIIYYNPNGFEIVQRKYRLKATFLKGISKSLYAPERGEMSSIIHEHPSCSVRYECYENNHLLFDLTSNYASFEAMLL